MKLTNQHRNNKWARNFLIILVLLGLNFVFIGESYYTVSQSQQLSLKNTNDLNNIGNLIEKVQSDILEVNSHAKEIQSNNQSINLAVFDEETSRIKENLSEIKTLMRYVEDKGFIGNLEETTTRYNYNVHNSSKLKLNKSPDIIEQFNSRMKDISNTVIAAKDEQLMDKFFILQSLQDKYLNLKDDTTPQAVIIAQKNFLDRVNRSSGDYDHVSKMMVQTISLMQSFELLKNSFEEKKFLVKQVETDWGQIQASLKQLLVIKNNYKNQDEQHVEQTEQRSFILFLSSIISVIISFAIGWFFLSRDQKEPMLSKFSANNSLNAS